MMWLASVMQMRKRRCAVAGTNVGSQSASRRSDSRISRACPISASACGVGCIPAGVRTNSGSRNWRRSLPSQMLTVGWLCPSRSAVRVTLRVA